MCNRRNSPLKERLKYYVFKMLFYVKKKNPNNKTFSLLKSRFKSMMYTILLSI